MVDLITLEEYTVRTGASLDAAQEARVASLINDASEKAIVEVARPSVTDAWTVETVPRAVVPTIVSVVKRAFENPDGRSSRSIAGYSDAVGYLAVGGSGQGSGVYFTPQEARDLRRAAGRRRIGARSMSVDLPGSPRDEVNLQWP